jgi:dienelactone hydrolase
MANILLFHPILGKRQFVLDTASLFQKAGHQVTLPDLFDGQIFDDMDAANHYFQQLGFPELVKRAMTAAAALPNDLVYAGFSLGGVLAEMLAARRPGARGCLLLHAGEPLAAFKLQAWPQGVPVQVHYSVGDPWREAGSVESLGESVRAAQASFEYFQYEGTGHLFSDPTLADYNPAAAQLMEQRLLEFLNKI